MNQQNIKLVLSLRHIGMLIEASPWGRCLIQRATYLMQATGVNMGWFFYWRNGAPFCDDLSSAIFSIASEMALEDPTKGWKLDESTIQSLNKVAPLVVGRRVHWVDLLACIHFFVARSGVPSDPKKIQSLLKEYEKPVSIWEVQAALCGLSDQGLI